MKKNKGFTLVELLGVIVLIGIIALIAVPSAITLSSKAKEKAYKAKIDVMEQNAVTYGQEILKNVREGRRPFGIGSGENYVVKFTYDASGKVDNVELTKQTYDESVVLPENQYWGFQLTLEELVDAKNLNYDKIDACPSCTSESDKANYNTVILNPKTNYIINKCNMYFYYKNQRVYTYFDEKTCNTQSDTPRPGNEYKPKY